jgi:glutathione synthase/RimK-type ligase-like ATP-grasp enzyme
MPRMSASADTVLVLTHTADHFVTERVAEALARRGVTAVRFDTDLFPLEAGSRRASPTGRALTRCAAGRSSSMRGACAPCGRAACGRRASPTSSSRPSARAACARRAAALRGWLTALADVRWVNPLDAGAAAEDKPRQLRLARELGLCVPRTLVTNDPDAVRAFREEVGPLVTKMLTPLSQSMGKAELFVRTSALRDEDLADLSGLALSPMVFQERIEKRRELRVACVGTRTFTGALDASRSAAGAVDWRAARPDEVRWEHAELDARVAERLARLLSALGLSYGAADLIETPSGETVFLELNPGGEWGMLERDLGLPIGEALAEELLGS